MDCFAGATGVFSSDLLITAIGYLDFFNWLKKKSIRSSWNLHRIETGRTTGRCNAYLFFISGTRRKKGAEFRISENGCKFLTAGSKTDLSGYFNSLRERPICRDILGVLKTNTPLHWAHSPKRDEWAKAMEKKDFAASFTAAMDSQRCDYCAGIGRKDELYQTIINFWISQERQGFTLCACKQDIRIYKQLFLRNRLSIELQRMSIKNAWPF